MNLLLTALVSLLVGLTEKVLPTFVLLWRERQARQDKADAEAKLAADVERIEKAIKAAQEGGK